MVENCYTLLTDIGKAKIANGIQSGTKVNFTTFKVGDSNGSYYQPNESQEKLVNARWEGPIGSVYIDENNSNWIIVDTIIPANVGGFFVREAGIFDDQNNLIAIAKLYERYKAVLEEDITKGMLIRLILEISNTSSINTKEGSEIFATREDVQALDAKIQDIQSLDAKIQNANIKLSEKAQLYIAGTLPTITEREANTLYFKVTDTLNINTNANITVSPTMGIKIQ